MTADDATANPTSPGPLSAPGADAPLAIEVRDLHKSFQIPTHRVDSFKERVVRPFATRDSRELRALDGVSFDIRQGEFFGIVGRNGSGKSTLLKLLASIYRADSGTIRMAGRLAPFIELGVGFNAELTARENVVLNGVMMGLTPQQMRSRLDTVVEFAELEEFIDLKLKNYSSGMMVRLAFSVMMQADADILLIDEVLAVGDAAFQQKCADAFHEMKAAGKTIVLVTHEMAAVESYCHRAMLIDDGHIQYLGDPAEVGRKYLRLNFEQGPEAGEEASAGESDEVRLLGAWIEGPDGAHLESVEHGGQIPLRIELEATQDLDGAIVGTLVANADGVTVSELAVPVGDGDEPSPLRAGTRVMVSVTLENLLVPGRYFVDCGIHRAGGGVSLYLHNVVDFVVYGGLATHGVVHLPSKAETSIDTEGGSR